MDDKVGKPKVGKPGHWRRVGPICAPEAVRAAMGAAGAVRLQALRSGGRMEEIVEGVR